MTLAAKSIPDFLEFLLSYEIAVILARPSPHFLSQVEVVLELRLCVEHDLKKTDWLPRFKAYWRYFSLLLQILGDSNQLHGHFLLDFFLHVIFLEHRKSWQLEGSYPLSENKLLQIVAHG